MSINVEIAYSFLRKIQKQLISVRQNEPNRRRIAVVAIVENVLSVMPRLAQSEVLSRSGCPRPSGSGDRLQPRTHVLVPRRSYPRVTIFDVREFIRRDANGD